MPMETYTSVQEDGSRHEYTVRTSHEIPKMNTSFPDEDDDQDVLLMPAWKRSNGQEIFYVVHANYAVTREAYLDGVKLGSQYAGEFRSVDFEPQLLFVNYLPVEDPSVLEGMKCTQPAHRGHSPQCGTLPDDYVGGYLRNNWEEFTTKLAELAFRSE